MSADNTILVLEVSSHHYRIGEVSQSWLDEAVQKDFTPELLDSMMRRDTRKNAMQCGYDMDQAQQTEYGVGFYRLRDFPTRNNHRLLTCLDEELKELSKSGYYLNNVTIEFTIPEKMHDGIVRNYHKRIVVSNLTTSYSSID